jgi:NADH-quinone oxidoreductase subunit J
MGPLTFFVLAAALIASALTVVLHPNPVKSALALIVTLFVLAVVFVFLEAHMIAALQVIVYAGAIMVLFLFVIMLLNVGDDVPERHVPRHAALALGAWLGGAVMAGELTWLFLHTSFGAPAAAPQGYGGAEGVARSLFTDFLLPFELTSILLLVAVVGAVVLAQRQAVGRSGQRQQLEQRRLGGSASPTDALRRSA